MGVKVMAGAIVAAAIGGTILRPFLPRLPLFKKLILTETSGGPLPAAGAPLKAGEDVWPFVGTVGVAVTDLKSGRDRPVPLRGRHAQCLPANVSVSGFVDAGAKVIVQEAGEPYCGEEKLIRGSRTSNHVL